MTVTLNFGVTLTADESSGEQNSTTSSVYMTDHDNDIAPATASGSSPLPEAFQSRLSDLSGSSSLPPPLSVAVSGYNGNAGSIAPLLTVSSPYTNLSFTDAGGYPLSGASSGLFTTDGREIFLYPDPANDNLVLGRVGTQSSEGSDTANPQGTIAFAIYLDETQTASGGSASVWIAQFTPIQHEGQTASGDSAVSLANHLWVSADEFTTFDLTGVPSGSNKFLMLGTTSGDVGLVITGFDPDRTNDKGQADGDTVNTSNAQDATAIGTNNQSIDPTKKGAPGEGMFFTFVTNPNPDYTVPNLTATEAKSDANIDFEGMHETTGAVFKIAQVTGDGAGATATLTAFKDTNPAEKKDAFFEDLVGPNISGGDDALVAITGVTVRDAAGFVVASGSSTSTTDSSPTITFNANGSVTVTGLGAGYTLQYITGTAVHDRVLIQNTGVEGAPSFDIGGLSLLGTTLTVAQVGSAIRIEDSAPTAVAVLGEGGVIHDETTGAQTGAGAQDQVEPLAVFNGIDNPSSDMSGYAVGMTAVIAASASDWGPDGPAAEGSMVYSLEVSAEGVDSGLTTTEGQIIRLYKDMATGLVVGRIEATDSDENGQAAFAIAINADTGILSLVQYHSIHHDDSDDANESASIVAEALLAVVTLKDKDGTTSQDSVSIGSKVSFLDDAPSVTVEADASAPDGLVTSDVGGPDVAFASFFGSFSLQYETGEDDEGVTIETSYALGLATQSQNSGLFSHGSAIYLHLIDGKVIGSTASTSDQVGNDNKVFTVDVDDDGDVTLRQFKAIDHEPNARPDAPFSEQVAYLAEGLIHLTATLKVIDGDLDTATASQDLDLGPLLGFADDGPTLSFGNLVGTGTNRPQYGSWRADAGGDGLGEAGLALAPISGFLQDHSGSIRALTVTLGADTPTSDDEGTYHFSGTLTGDFDNNVDTADTSVAFSLTAYADGHYAFELDQAITSSFIRDTTTGKLRAGGPDAVQKAVTTLDISAGSGAASASVVFFSVKANASDAQIQSDLCKTEVQLESAKPGYIDPRALNVSNAGIGVGNNLLEGGTALQKGQLAESMVINPTDPVQAIRVFIDQSVGGYSYTGGERLSYQVFFNDGTWSDETLVTQDLWTPGKETGFDILVPDGKSEDVLIDAVQLTMRQGTVKISHLQFTTLVEAAAPDVLLNFTATYDDYDHDIASADFSVELEAHQVGTPPPAFDYLLVGGDGRDTFNIDLSSSKDRVQISDFDVDEDVIYLLGDSELTMDNVLINNTGDDSVITITDPSTSQVTTVVTVEGIDVIDDYLVLGA